MTQSDLVAYRLSQQRLISGRITAANEVVRWFGAVQAQDYYGAKWAIGLRSSARDAAIEEAFNAGAILRTHLLRPTWHFAVPSDIRWLLNLTAPRVHAANAFMYRKLGLDAKVFRRSNDALARALQGGGRLDRAELASVLQRERIETSDLRFAYLLMRAELDAIICSGPRKGRRFTYALLDERVPETKVLPRDEALAELTLRYFTSRGPATLRDFVWWSGLTMADARAGLAMVRNRFTQVQVDGQDHWFARSSALPKVAAGTVHLLPNYDEYGIAYKDRKAFYDPEEAAGARRAGISVFRHLLVVDGLIRGTWERNLLKDSVSVVTSPFSPLTRTTSGSVRSALRRYARFLGMPLADRAE
jgi:hypothetical protein